MASSKTGCTAVVRIAMMKKQKPANGSNWTADDTPCGGYHVSTGLHFLLPCCHNHYSSAGQGERPLVESVSQIPPAVREEIKSLVLANFSSYRIRNFISQKHELPPLTPAVWTSLVRSIKIELGVQDAGDDLKILIERLTSERNERGAVFDMQVDSYGDLTVNTIFFMSRAMLQSFRRCGQFAVMDSTCKTNRFGLNLFLVCGIDEHQHIALFAAAFMKEETQPRFEYVLQQMKRAVGEEAWFSMACVATDGCLAMTNALFEIAPHAEQQRCVWHLQQNIIKHAGGAGHHKILSAWWACVYAKTHQEFESRWRELLAAKMGAKTSEYLTQRILPLAPKWALYATGTLTNFGSHSTQLVESLNRLLKMWDASDRTSLSQAVQRICTVKDEELTRRQITAMKDQSANAMARGSTAGIQLHDSYNVKTQKMLTGAAAKLCEAQYNLYSQYKVTGAAAECGLFTLATQTFTVQHKVEASSVYLVHVSPSLIYCPCGYMFNHLLPCRHILAANGVAFADIFQPDQYHPRWWLSYTPVLLQQLLPKQFWISIGREVTADGLRRVRYDVQSGKHLRAHAHEEPLELDGGGGDMDSELHHAEPAAAAAVASAAATTGASALPEPMFPSAVQLQPTQMSSQQLYHMIEGECQQLRQLACTNPAQLTSMVWLGLNNLKRQVELHIDVERRQQQHQLLVSSAAVAGNLTSQGLPMSVLMAPVPLTATKPGRPSSKRARAAVEGIVARKVQVMLPAAAAAAVAAAGVGGSQVSGGGHTVADVLQAAAVASGCPSTCPSAAVSVGCVVPVSSAGDRAEGGTGTVAAVGCVPTASAGVRSSQRGLVPRVPFDR